MIQYAVSAKYQTMIDKGILPLPGKAYKDDAGWSLYLVEWLNPQGFNKRMPVVQPGEKIVIDTGLMISLPRYVKAEVVNRSSYIVAGMIIPPNLIDPGYTGTIKVVQWNVSKDPYTFNPHDNNPIAQLVLTIQPSDALVQVDRLVSKSDRGERWAGSSNR